jgi:hypothetical protein
MSAAIRRKTLREVVVLLAALLQLVLRVVLVLAVLAVYWRHLHEANRERSQQLLGQETWPTR